MSPGHRAARWASWLLRLAILLFAIGLARAMFTRTGTSLGSIALLEWDVSHENILLGEKWAGVLVLLAAVTLCWRPMVVAAAFISVVVLVEAFAGVHAGGQLFSDQLPLANALRYLVPLSLIPLIGALPEGRTGRIRYQLAAWILKIGLAVVFATHGMEAWRAHPQFIDYLIASGRRVFGWQITESAAVTTLKIIGGMDFALALLVLVRPVLPLLGWMAFWGLITAVSRPLSYGWESWPEIFLRASHFIAPLALWQLLLASRSPGLKETDVSDHPEGTPLRGQQV